MSFRPTTIERAYELARSGACRTVGDVKQRLKDEGFERVQDSLYGASITRDLRRLCQENWQDPDTDQAPGHGDAAPGAETP